MKQGMEKFLWLKGRMYYDLTYDCAYEPKVFTKDKMISRKQKRNWRKRMAKMKINEQLED